MVDQSGQPHQPPHNQPRSQPHHPQMSPYPPSHPPPPYVMYGYRPKTCGFAVASLVLGIVWVYWVGSILALVFGYVARRQIRERGERGDGMAVAGIVLGWVGIGILALVIILGIVMYNSLPPLIPSPIVDI